MMRRHDVAFWKWQPSLQCLQIKMVANAAILKGPPLQTRLAPLETLSRLDVHSCVASSWHVLARLEDIRDEFFTFSRAQFPTWCHDFRKFLPRIHCLLQVLATSWPLARYFFPYKTQLNLNIRRNLRTSSIVSGKVVLEKLKQLPCFASSYWKTHQSWIFRFL